MGQNSSRYTTQPPVDSSNVDDHRSPPRTTNTPFPTTQSHSEDAFGVVGNDSDARSPRPPRRSLVRRSLLNLVKPSSRTSTQEESMASTSSSTSRRSWLHSKRWSRSPLHTREEKAHSSSHINTEGHSNIRSIPAIEGQERGGCSSSSVYDSHLCSTTAQSSTDAHSILHSTSATNQQPAVDTRPELFQQGTIPFQGSSQIESTSRIPQLASNSDEASPLSITESLSSPEQNHISQLSRPLSRNLSPNALGNDLASIHSSTPNPTASSGEGETMPRNSEPLDDRPSTSTSAVPTPAAQRAFPPPGTLVVVQGVVHTTDVPRSSNSPSTPGGESADQGRAQSESHVIRSTSRETGNSNNQSGQSCVLRSPSTDATSVTSANEFGETEQLGSTATRRGSTAATRGYASNVNIGDLPCSSSNRDGITAIGSESTPPTSGNEAEQTNGHVTPSLSAHDAERQGVEQHNNDDSTGSGAISSSSIDVLGTLLSVAAAATAASLLTGSSEPILPSNLSPNTNVHLNPSTSPVLPTGSAATPSNGVSPPEFSSSGRTERMRNAWASIRERLGIRSSGSSNSVPASTNIGGIGATAQTPTDTREVMLSEMARAFSVGLGLGGFGSTSNNGNMLTRSAETPDSRSPPSEGSFERFLMDLQADLRLALTTGQGGSGIRAMAAGSGWSDMHNSISNDTPRPIAETPTTHESSDVDSTSDVPEVGQPREELLSTNDVSELRDFDDLDEEPHEPFDSGATGEEESGDQEHEPQVLNGPGRINWWRLYRFPPIAVPRGNPAASAAAAAALSSGSEVVSSASSPETAPSSSDFVETHSTTSETTTVISSNPDNSSTDDTEHRSSGDQTRSQQNTVVPVIIVGLQSVHMDLRQARANASNAEGHTVDERSNDDESQVVDNGIDDIFGSSVGHDTEDSDTASVIQPNIGLDATDEGPNNQQRGRRWRSRAADAIRNLRSRRGGESRNDTADDEERTATSQDPHTPTMGPGSRMFLIYVIGGYYPPNHSIVLGNPADLESFEALSELAELLGQVKPPTATKEEIERSGLQVIKASQVEGLERQGKIAGNCTEKCLICLDDYDVEDDVRIMTCKHAFHKDCVDKWLQTGKNNCPACRSKGVSAESPSSVS